MISHVVTILTSKYSRICVFLDIQQRRPVANVRPFLLRRGTHATAPSGGSFKRRSLKLRRNTKEGKDLQSDCNSLFYLSTLAPTTHGENCSILNIFVYF